MSDLSKRAVACKGWRWMPGMLDTTGRRFIEYADCGEAAWLWVADDGCEWLPVEGRLPDLTDPATLGCLLALVREAYGKPGILARRFGSSLWRVYDDAWLKRAPLGKGATEAEALVAALEDADGREVSDE